MTWLDGLVRHQQAGRGCVVVTITAIAGSAPRGVGTRMTVGPESFDGTIGGGALELTGLARARELLARCPAEIADVIETFPLGRALSQCCGGKVTLRFEHYAAIDFHVQVFGAGHVGQELARLLIRLPCRATFHDGRPEWLARLRSLEGGDSLGRTLLDENVPAAVEAGPAQAYWLVMTHSHALDLEVVEAVLARGDSRYCGLIASRSKATSFRGRLTRKGFSAAEIARLTAPLGQRVRTGNTPMEVALAAVADVLDARAMALPSPAGSPADSPADSPAGSPAGSEVEGDGEVPS